MLCQAASQFNVFTRDFRLHLLSWPSSSALSIFILDVYVRGMRSPCTRSPRPALWSRRLNYRNSKVFVEKKNFGAQRHLVEKNSTHRNFPYSSGSVLAVLIWFGIQWTPFTIFAVLKWSSFHCTKKFVFIENSQTTAIVKLDFSVSKNLWMTFTNWSPLLKNSAVDLINRIEFASCN